MNILFLFLILEMNLVIPFLVIGWPKNIILKWLSNEYFIFIPNFGSKFGDSIFSGWMNLRIYWNDYLFSF